MTRQKATLIMFSTFGVIALLGGLWWALFSLKPYELSSSELQARYALPSTAASAPTLTPLSRDTGPGHAFELRFRSFDGDQAVGRLVFPSDPAQAQQAFPLMVAMHGLGRTHLRWWQAQHKERPTIEQTHRITELALAKGWAVLALDARRHAAREPGFAASDLFIDMKLWGQREPYEQMIVDTVRDYRLLLNWVTSQPQLDASRIGVAGYSMGAQMALLLGGIDARVSSVLAIVPPHLDNKVAVVAPRNALSGLKDKRVWLLSADDDDHASAEQNQALFDALPTNDKRHLRFPGGHVLPADYVTQLPPWWH